MNSQEPSYTNNNLREIHKLLLNATQENKQAKEQIPPEVKIATLTNDTNYIKFGLYFLGLILFFFISSSWIAFLHLDDKIERKMDYLNQRIDTNLKNNNK